MMKHPPCAFEVSESPRYFSGCSLLIWQPNTKYLISRALRIPQGLALRAVPGTTECPLLVPQGYGRSAVPQRAATGAEDGRVTSFPSHETWHCSET